MPKLISFCLALVVLGCEEPPMDDWDNSEGWDTSCDSAYCFDGHPIKDHKYKFCPNCGKPIECVPAKGERDASAPGVVRFWEASRAGGIKEEGEEGTT